VAGGMVHRTVARLSPSSSSVWYHLNLGEKGKGREGGKEEGGGNGDWNVECGRRDKGKVV